MKPIKKILKRVAIAVLPARIRDELVRRSVKLPQNLSDDLVFKIAETVEELEASFKLVYESYLALGYCSENEMKMRATVYHALPTTTTLIALDKGVVVGTLTVVRDNRLGLPMEKVFDVDCLRKDSNRLAEITSLVIHKDYRREKGGQILFPLLRLMYEYSTKCFGVNHLVVLIHPKDDYFYKSLLLFHRIPNTGVKDYLGAPAAVFHLDLKRALREFEQVYSKKAPQHNLFDFFVQKRIPNVLIPERKYNKINDPIVSPAYLHSSFFKILGESKDSHEKRKIINSVQPDGSLNLQPRIEVDAPAILKITNTTELQEVEYHVIIKDVCKDGFRAFSHHKIDMKQKFEARVSLGPNIIARLTVEALWERENVGVGFRVVGVDQRWLEFIDFLYQEHFIEERAS